MEQIEYTRTVVPSSMRSPYWKYFGFPSDSSNNILTRQKIVCTVCNTIIAYNKNTSNLRTHLMSKHIEIFKKIVPPSNVGVAQSRIEENCEYQSNKRQCVQVLNNGYEVDSFIRNENNSSENCIISPGYENIESKRNRNQENGSNFTTNNLNYETQSSDFIAYFPANDTEIPEVVHNGEVLKDGNTAYAINTKAATYADVYIPDENDQQRSVDIMLADYIQTDLLPIETLKELGFCNYNQHLTGMKVDDDTVLRVKGIIKTRFMNVKQTATLHVNRLSQSNPYSLGFEIYNDSEGQDLLNIYFNYLNEKQVDLISILYTSCLICSEDVNISQLLNDINLANCSGIVVTCVDNEFQFVSDFAYIHELPLIECLESLLSRCLKKIFDKTEFYEKYKKFLKTILEKKNVISLPTFMPKTRCQWSPLIFLEHVFDNVEQDQVESWDEFKESYEYLKPLKVAMDIIMDEPLPLCSLTRPLIKKLFEDHLISLNQKDTSKSLIREILKELYERILANTFLKEVTFFDIRFHRDFNLREAFSDATYLKGNVLKRFKNILQVTNLDKEANNAGLEQHYTDSSNIPKCSSLKSFFKRVVSSPNAALDSNLKTNLDLEFEQYYNQACLDLDQSPILWWQQHTGNYKKLSKIAKYYLTIPCCCAPRLCRINLEKRYLKIDRRSKLSQFCNTESKLWYLYYNEVVTQFV